MIVYILTINEMYEGISTSVCAKDGNTLDLHIAI